MNMFKNKLRRALTKKIVPAAIYGLYFNRQLAAQEKLLSEQLANDEDLLARLSPEKRLYWQDRINMVLACPDNEKIKRVADAGKLIDGKLIMHNGLKVDPLSYYSYPMLKMLMENGGVHEPQEENIFQEVLRSLADKEGMTFMELGAYWAFYSMWFQKAFPEAECIMVEPDRRNLFFGKQNFRVNDLQGKFLHYGIGGRPDRSQNITTVDALCRLHKLSFLDILHADIQGFELDMLHGAAETLRAGRIGYVFISTHSNELHESCRRLLSERYQFQLVADANVDESYSWDGILVMKAPDFPGPDRIEISKRNKNGNSESKD